MNVKRNVVFLCALILLSLCLTSCDLSLSDILSKFGLKDSEAQTEPLSPVEKDPADEDVEESQTFPEGTALYSLHLTNKDTTLGTLSGTGSFPAGHTVTVKAIPSLLGYTLEGWYEDGKLVSQSPTYSFKFPKRNVTLEARWKTDDALSGFTFISTATTCTITGVSDRSAASLIVPDYVTELGAGAFKNCTALQALKLPASITAIPDEAFRGCTALTALECEGEIIKIGEHCFTDCNPAVLRLYEGALYLEGDTPYTWLITVADETVSNCTVHPQTKHIADQAFAGCKNLKTVSIPETGNLISIGKRAFSECSSLEEIVIPEGITVIDAHTFDGCTALATVHLPASLTHIEVGGFDHCPALTNVRFGGDTEQWERMHMETGNNRLDALAIHCQNGDVVYEIRGYGRAHLYKNEAYVYDLLADSLFSDNLPDAIQLDPDRGVTPQQCKTAFEIFLLDHPECFWLKQSFSYTPTYTGSSTVSAVKPQYLVTGAELAAAKKRLQQTVEEILKDMPAEGFFEQTHYLHDTVVNRVTYIEIDDWDQTSYGALVDGTAVCAGYSAAYQLLLQSAGYKAWSVNGYSRNQAHRWNIVWLDHATCVYTDVTWDDYRDQQVLHGYFNRSLEEFEKTHIVDNPFPLPECNHENAGYFDHPSRQYQVINEADTFDKLKPLLEKQADGSYFARLFYTGENFMSWLVEHQEELTKYCGFTKISLNLETQSSKHTAGEILLYLSGS